MQLCYGITPPKLGFSEPRRQRVAAAQVARIAALPIDALIIYDLQDESSRTQLPRPFPFVETVDPASWAYDYLAGVPQQKVLYRSVGGQSPEALVAWLAKVEARGDRCVLVGAPSREQAVRLRLEQAYALQQARCPTLTLGGITIAERHARRGNEHERLLTKRAHGCSFFISQAVFCVTQSMNLLSDLHYACAAQGVPVPPVLVTLSPCGSVTSLEFMRWLGVSVPPWVENEIRHASDPLATSVELARSNFAQLLDFARAKGIPLGCNIESVSRRRAEIDASVELLHSVAAMLGRGV